MLTSEAKEALRRTVRGLRTQLLAELGDAAKSEYRLDVSTDAAKLPEARRCRRERLERWMTEQARAAGIANDAGPTSGRSGKPGKGTKGAKAKAGDDATSRFLHKATAEAAYTLLHRLVILRILEHHDRVSPKVLTGAWQSPAYEQEFVHYAGPLAQDDTRGYRDLLAVMFDELALELPGLFGPVGLTALFPVPAATLRVVVTALNAPELLPAWGDDTTLGWVYQYWNDPEREALDAKIACGGKIEPHEIASKTQMFTERYMVEWLLQNSLGLTWLSVCKKNGWTPAAEAVVAKLEERRAAWREKRDKGVVALDALMPIAPASEDGGLEEAWKYYVPQPLPEDAAAKAPSSIREVKLLDPACGSGHFLVIAFGLLQITYREEARHRGEAWSEAEITRWIVEENLHGVDIDPRAVQIAAAALWLRVKLTGGEGAGDRPRFGRINLVAPAFGLGALPKDDPALVTLYEELGARGVPRTAVEGLVQSLRGVDYMGTLLRVDRAIAELLDDTEKADGPLQAWGAHRNRAALEAKVADFLDAHAAEADLGLRLEGEQLAAGLRFVQVVREGRYDVVVGNPPYQGLSKTSKAFEAVAKAYPSGKADLYAAFLLRGLELVKEGGLSALITMRGWMFLGQFEALRKWALHEQYLVTLGDVDRGAFEEVPDEVLSTVMSVLRRAPPSATSVAIQPTPLDDRTRDSGRTPRKRAALLAHVGRHTFDPRAFAVIDGKPLVYWWSKEFLSKYARAPKLGDSTPGRAAQSTGNNTRFLRRPWEVAHGTYGRTDEPTSSDLLERQWVPFMPGAEGLAWFEPLREVVNWRRSGLEIKQLKSEQTGREAFVLASESFFFGVGVAFSMIGNAFLARAHRFRSVLGDKGSSLYPPEVGLTVCQMNRADARRAMESLNPSVSFQVGDVNRMPLFPVMHVAQIWSTLGASFEMHERAREASVEFRSPGPSTWHVAQDWASAAIESAAPRLAPFEARETGAPPLSVVSFSIGVAFGRFGANGEGILDAAPKDALPNGILFVGPGDTLKDSLAHSAAARVVAAWEEQAPAILGDKKLVPLRDWLRNNKSFFAYHKGVYENRPIYLPLSSSERSFVAWISIHRWTDQTLQALMVDHLKPALTEVAGGLADLATARASSDKKTAVAADKQYTTQKRLHDELEAFLADVRQVAERGPEPTSPDANVCPPCEVDKPFHMDLDDGVMINSAALWKLLAPQWSDPKKWWTQLAKAEGNDYDWSQLAKRYFPDRVDAKCKDDPSLAVAHGCFWRYHPAKAYAWELRLQDEIRPDFTLDEPGSDEARAAFEKTHPEEAAALRDKEAARRTKKAQKTQEVDHDEPTSESAEELQE